MRENTRQTKVVVPALVLLVLGLLLAVACNGESPTQYKWHETYDEVRNGVRVVLSHPGWGDFFTGSAENTTDETIKNVRVVVRTSTGFTLVTTPPTNLESGEIMAVHFDYLVRDPFGTWTAYPEVGVDPAAVEAQEEITWNAESATKAQRPPIQDFVELLDIRLDRHHFPEEDVLVACQYLADPEGGDSSGQAASKSAERVREIAQFALYPEGAELVYHAEIDPFPERDDGGSYDEEAEVRWSVGFTAWLTPQIDELMDLFCPEVFARDQRGVDVIGQLPHPADVTGALPPRPLTQEDVNKFYISLPPSERSDPAVFGDRCDLFRKHNWDVEKAEAELRDEAGPGQFPWWFLRWFELAGLIVKTPEWEQWMLQEYDLPQDRRRWERTDEWVIYWKASEPRELQLVQMFCEEH